MDYDKNLVDPVTKLRRFTKNIVSVIIIEIILAQLLKSFVNRSSLLVIDF